MTDVCTASRLPLIQQAFRLEWLTIGFVSIEAAVSIAAGIMGNSLVLLAFGLDSVI
jgi:divalent metal cation (Fe/Co/Zn/Cd) transporter